MTSPTLNLAPQARQQLAAVAGLRWRVFINSLRTFRGRLELASRIFISLAFLGGGIGGAVGLGGAAWFLILHGNVEWLGTLLWPVFLFWQLFPLMATAFTQNVESSNLLRFPLSYRSYFLIRLAYGSLDPATAVASLWLLGIDVGIGIARPRALPWATIVLLTFALVNIVLARMLFAWLERWLAQRRTREILGILFFLFILSFQLIGPLIADVRVRPPVIAARCAGGWSNGCQTSVGARLREALRHHTDNRRRDPVDGDGSADDT